MKKNILSLTVCLSLFLAFALPVLANVPAPPVNQTIGVPDTEFSHLTEADCRLCHEDPDIVGPTTVPDRHHLLYGSAITTGECATWNGTCSVSGDPCLNDGDCPVTETCTAGTRACLTDVNCTIGQNVCNVTGSDCPVGTCSITTTTSCIVDSDCPASETCDAGNCPGRSGQFCGEPICQGGSAVQDPDSDQNGTMDTTYACLSCHVEDTTGGIITLQVFRDCLLCHYQALDTPTVHHQTADAQSGVCSSCHGTLVDDVAGCKELMCAPTGNVCTGDNDTNCSTDADCATAGGTCNTSARGNPNAYGAPIPCPSEDAAGTAFCQANAGVSRTRCGGYGGGLCSVTTTAECITDSDCPTSETCVNTCDDGHVIPTYDPSLVTPERSSHAHVCEGTTDVCATDDDCDVGTCSTTTTTTCHVDLDCPATETCNGGVECVEDADSVIPGNCAYCHNAGANTVGTVMDVLDNHDTHHHTGIYKNLLGGSNSAKCAWCHMAGYAHTPYGETAEHIRWCENCHGYESLHNIAIDSDTGCLFGDPGCEVVIGGELAGYSHVGNNDDCWGCHGFTTAAAPGAGPATPYLLGSDTLGATSGYDTMVTLIGATLQNLVGSYLWSSDITMTGADGSAVTLTPESATSNQLAVTIPAATAPGNYALRAVKGTYAASNPIVISVKPEVVITDSSCNKKKGVLTVSGSGFGEKPAGTDGYINVQVDGQTVDITSWSDSQITAAVSSCRNNAGVTVNALMGTATNGSSGGGKPDKPCKGKKCN